MALDILIVDDEADIRDLIAGVLSDEGYATRVAANSDDKGRAQNRRVELITLDNAFPVPGAPTVTPPPMSPTPMVQP